MRAAIVVLALAMPAPAAAAAAAPDATTGAATNVGLSTATIAGTVNPQGVATSYRFDYGTTASYGLQTSAGDAGAGSAGLGVHADLSGLTADTLYHYRVVAINGDGTTPGADRTFRTAAVITPPRATTGAARNVTATGARLTGTVVPNGGATTYRFEYGTTTQYGSRTGEIGAGTGRSGVAAAASIGGLRANTRYHYRLVATNAAGVTAGRDRTFTTARSPRAITVSASPNPAPWSGSTTVRGRVTGRGVGGLTVALERQDFPFSRPYYPVGTRRTASNGTFSFAVGPLWAVARLRLVTRTAIVAVSPVVEVRNALRVGLLARRIAGGRVRLGGSVSPAVPKGRASLQKRSPHGRWVTVRRSRVKPLRDGRSQYAFTVRRRGTYRVMVLPRDAFAHVRGTSRERRISR
jgi:hypothetical protein